ncbi:MAG: PQQ-binding-like beta-propeller repeat protein [Phycisphaerales bacterium JB040]
MVSGRIALLVSGATALVLVCGCGSSGSRAQTEPAPSTTRTQPATGTDRTPVTALDEATIDHEAWKQLGYRWAWAGYPQVSPGAAIEEIEAYDDRIVTRDSNTVVSVMQSNTGRLVWGAEMDRPETKVLGLERDGDTLLFTTETQLHEVEMDTGNLLARTDFQKLVNTEPVLNGSRAIFGTLDGELIAIDREHNLTDWRYGVGGTISANPVLMNPYELVAVSQTGEVATIDLDGPSAKVVERISGGVASNPVTDFYYVVIASLDRSVYGFAEGRRIWRYRTSEPLKVQPVMHGDVVYFASPSLGVVCLDKVSGEEVWRQPDVPNGWIVGVRDGELLAWNGVTLAALDPENGDIIVAARFPGIRGIQTDKFENGNLYAVAGRGTVLKFEPR